MIRDWDLWPWIVARAADESGLSLETRRLVGNIARVQRAVGLELYPVIRRLARALAQLPPTDVPHTAPEPR